MASRLLSLHVDALLNRGGLTPKEFEYPAADGKSAVFKHYRL